MANTTTANISIVAPHEVQSEIQRLFKQSIGDMRRELGGNPEAPAAGKYLRPELCIDHVNLYYIDGDDTWRYDMALVAKRYPDAQIYYKEMRDEGRDGAATNDAEGRFFMPYGVMVTNYWGRPGRQNADWPQIRRACSEIWTKQNTGLRTADEAERFVANMRQTFPDLDKWVGDGDMALWITHFEPETFDADSIIARMGS